jgi:hypothetical protein
MGIYPLSSAAFPDCIGSNGWTARPREAGYRVTGPLGRFHFSSSPIRRRIPRQSLNTKGGKSFEESRPSDKLFATQWVTIGSALPHRSSTERTEAVAKEFARVLEPRRPDRSE